jgi:hypothetical protein
MLIENNNRIIRYLRQHSRDIAHLAISAPISALYATLGNYLMGKVDNHDQQNLSEEYLQTLLVMAIAMKLGDISTNLAARICSPIRTPNFKLSDLVEIPLSAAYMMALHPILMPNMTTMHMDKNHVDGHNEDDIKLSTSSDYATMTAIAGTSIVASKATIATTKLAGTLLKNTVIRICSHQPLATQDSMIDNAPAV